MCSALQRQSILTGKQGYANQTPPPIRTSAMLGPGPGLGWAGLGLFGVGAQQHCVHGHLKTLLCLFCNSRDFVVSDAALLCSDRHRRVFRLRGDVPVRPRGALPQHSRGIPLRLPGGHDGRRDHLHRYGWARLGGVMWGGAR